MPPEPATPPEIRTAPLTEDARTRILAVIDAHAQGLGLPFDGEHVQVEAWEGETWLGGLAGRTHQRWFYVVLLGVAAPARGRDIGTRLMEEMEHLSRARNLIGVWLDTYSFQAPRFYARLGYEVIGRIPDYPPGRSGLFLAKRLDGRPVADGGPARP